MIDGSFPYDTRDIIRNKILEADSQIRFLFVTPEVVDANRIMSSFLQEIITESELVNYIVVYEAQKLIDATYREAFEAPGEFRLMNNEIPWIALTSVNRHLEGEIARKLNMENPLYLTSPLTRDNIFYDVVSDGLKEGHKINEFIESFKQDGKIPAGIIFCNYSKDIKKTISYLKSVDIEAGAYHRNFGNKFKRWTAGEFPVFVTTGESLGYGINFNVPAIRFVIHLYMPNTLRSFYHVGLKP